MVQEGRTDRSARKCGLSGSLSAGRGLPPLCVSPARFCDLREAFVVAQPWGLFQGWVTAEWHWSEFLCTGGCSGGYVPKDTRPPSSRWSGCRSRDTVLCCLLWWPGPAASLCAGGVSGGCALGHHAPVSPRGGPKLWAFDSLWGEPNDASGPSPRGRYLTLAVAVTATEPGPFVSSGRRVCPSH